MQRARVRDAQKAMEGLWELIGEVRPLNHEIFHKDDEILVIKDHTVITYWKATKGQLSNFTCARNLAALTKVLGKI